ncbi:glycoside hydrolase family 43 protein [Saccharibacillus sacchari]|uniref:Glycoside hydrolase family 43 protein n=1 Tax=Saccharibacillus sacchari TaxID=456493 RepID=A0ACC6PGF6_9BACL
MEYANPVIPGFHPDPSICRVGDDYYLVTSTFEYFPGVPVFHSRDLVNWRRIGHCLTTETQLPLHTAGSSGGIYAPTLRHHGGWFYMTTTNVSGIGNFYVRSQRAEGPWSEPIAVDQGGIDPSLLFDDDGTVYFQTAQNGPQGEGIYQCEIDIDTGEKLAETRLIWPGTGGASPEAPHLYKVNGSYYLMIAEGGTEYGHMETVARSHTPYGPFEACPHNPILTQRSLPSSIQGAGHADLVQTPAGDWWAVFLGIRPPVYPKRHHLGRETFLAPVTWTEDGWPIIGENGRVCERMDAPALAPHPWPSLPVRDDFIAAELDPEWIFLRNPAPGSWSLEERPGHLALRGGEVTLDEIGPLAFVGRRLSHFDCRLAAQLDFEPASESEEAGMTLFMNGKYHYDLAVTQREGRKAVILRRTVGSLRTEQVFDCGFGPVELRVHAESQRFVFFFREANGSEIEVGWGETHFLSTEIAGGFTGVIAAMYAVSGGETAQATSAFFDWFDYEPLNA